MRWGVVVVCSLAASACGRIHFDPLTDASTADATPDAWVCALPYQMVAGSCYRVETTPQPWLVAEQQCESEGSHLITVIDIPEHFVLHTLSTNAAIATTWVGYTDRVSEGTFQWVTPGGLDPAIDSCFLGLRLNGATTDCMIQDGANACPDWTIVDCTAPHAFVCEHDGVAADPSAY